MKITGSTLDLSLTRNGDISFSSTLDGDGDILSTFGDPLAVIRQTALTRLGTHSSDWGNDSSNVILFNSPILSEGPFSLFKVMMDLGDFHGQRIDATTMGAIRDSVQSGIEKDSAFANVPYELSVTRMSTSVFAVMLAFRATKQFIFEFLYLAGSGGNAIYDEDRITEIFETESALLILTSQYDTSTEELSISVMDAKEYLRESAKIAGDMK